MTGRVPKGLATAKHRVFIHQGSLTKLCRKIPKKREFFLFNDLLLYGEEVLSNYRIHRCINLRQSKIVPVDDTAAHQNAFAVISSHKSFLVWADTPEEKAGWAKKIEEAKEKLDSLSFVTSEDLPQSEVFEAPIWVNDKEVNNCMLCSIKFTKLRRRHHCRKCGAIACGKCSENKYYLPSLSGGKVRVCDECWQKLSGVTTKRMSRRSFRPNTTLTRVDPVTTITRMDVPPSKESDAVNTETNDITKNEERQEIPVPTGPTTAPVTPSQPEVNGVSKNLQPKPPAQPIEKPTPLPATTKPAPPATTKPAPPATTKPAPPATAKPPLKKALPPRPVTMRPQKKALPVIPVGPVGTSGRRNSFDAQEQLRKPLPMPPGGGTVIQPQRTPIDANRKERTEALKMSIAQRKKKLPPTPPKSSPLPEVSKKASLSGSRKRRASKNKRKKHGSKERSTRKKDKKKDPEKRKKKRTSSKLRKAKKGVTPTKVVENDLDVTAVDAPDVDPVDDIGYVADHDSAADVVADVYSGDVASEDLADDYVEVVEEKYGEGAIDDTVQVKVFGDVEITPEDLEEYNNRLPPPLPTALESDDFDLSGSQEDAPPVRPPPRPPS
eukprot:TRINITY_DN1448_c0_g1_i1.p1 TRINITY_DN1448_c0_g1~~TRINITY_DN1448_c0_g1_i1.p1  ORF type:complete len:697 (+),score=158.37 TRINITY_DN1448_c0_g1_i1:269-2092(+)